MSLIDENNGLQIEFFLGESSVDTIRESSNGIVLSIHNKSIKPFSEGNTVMATPVAYTDIIVDRNYVTKLSKPYGSCLEDVSEASKFS